MGFLFWVLVHPKIKAAFEKIGYIRMHSQRQKAVYDGSPPLQHHLPRDTRLCEEELFFLAHLKHLPFVEICPVESFLLFTPTASQKGKKCKKKKERDRCYLIHIKVNILQSFQLIARRFSAFQQQKVVSAATRKWRNIAGFILYRRHWRKQAARSTWNLPERATSVSFCDLPFTDS